MAVDPPCVHDVLMRMRIRALSLLLVFAVANAAAPESSKLDFEKVDKDANGLLSKEETLSVAELEAEFATLDADHDGFLSASEFSKWNRAGKVTPPPRDPTTVPGGSAGGQHMPKPRT